MRLIAILLFGISFAASAYEHSRCVHFFAGSQSMRPLGPAAQAVKSLFSFNQVEVQKANDRLYTSSPESQIVKEKKRDEALIQELSVAKMSMEDAAVRVKKMFKYRILFSELHSRVFDYAFKDQIGNLTGGSTFGTGSVEQRMKLASLLRMVESQYVKDLEGVEVFVQSMSKKLVGVMVFKNWFEMSTVQKDKIAREKASLLGLSKRDPNLEDYFNNIQILLAVPENVKLIESIFRRSLASQIKSKIDDVADWKSRSIGWGLLAASATLGAFGIITGMPELGLTGVWSALPAWINVMQGQPWIRGALARSRFNKTNIKEQERLLVESQEKDTVKVVESEIRASERQEDQADFSFSSIVRELESGLSKDEVFKVSLWGQEFQRGLANLAQRQHRLDSRLELIAGELDPFLKMFKDRTPTASELAVFNRLVEVGGSQVQNLLLDYAFLRSDYMTLAITLDSYTDILHKLKSSGELQSEHLFYIHEKMDRLKRAQEIVILSAEKTNGAREAVHRVIRNLNDYHEITMMDLATSLRTHRAE